MSTTSSQDGRQGEANNLVKVTAPGLSDYGSSINFQQQSLEIDHQISDRLGAVNVLGNLGNAYLSLGNYTRAIDLHQEHLDVARQTGDRLGELISLGNLGLAYQTLDDYGSAIAFHKQSLDIARQIENRRGEASALGNLGLVYDALGDYGQAIDFHQQSLDIARQIENRRGEASSLGNLGIAHHTLGNYERAIDFHQQSLFIAREISQRQREASALGNLGNTYRALGDYERAIDFHQHALVIDRETENRRGEASALGNLGIVYHGLGDYERAIDFHQQSLVVKREIGYRLGEANALSNLGIAYHKLGDYERAIDFHQQSLNIAREIGQRQGEGSALGNLGNTYRALGNYEQAIDLHREALNIKRQIGDRQGESNVLHNLGVVFGSVEDLADAERYFQLATQVKESLHTGGLADASRLSLLDSQQNTYSLWQLTLIAQGHPEKALAVSERSRAQALAISMARRLAPGDELEALTPPDLNRIRTIAAKQNATLVEYSVLPSGKIFIWVIQSDGTLHFKEVAVATLDNALVAAATLDDALVETTNIFTDLRPNSRGGELPETSLSKIVQDTQVTLTRGPSDSQSQLSRTQLDTQLQQLHKALIEPIAQWLPTDDQQRVIFIPHRELFRVPFAALQDSEGHYLIQQHTILTAPSIQSIELTRQHRARIQAVAATDALIVGNPTFSRALENAYGWQALPGAEREARNVGNYLSQYLGTSLNVLFHNQATETLVKERLHTARFIHLATHGTLASSNEPSDLPFLQYSTIPGVLGLAASLEDDGHLTADELLEMTTTNPLNAELVVLTACQTAGGPITSDGVYGLSRTLLTAGVPTLVVSLWNASDHHTVGLMDEFYRQFLEEDQDKAQALRQAMLQMIEQGDDNPQYWATFTLLGEAT